MASQAAPTVSSGIKTKTDIDTALSELASGEKINFVAGAFDTAGVPSAAANEGRVIHVSDGDTGSPCLAYSNGTNWLRIAFGAAIAAA